MKTCPKCGNEYPDTTTLCPADGVALTKQGDSLVGKTLAGKYRVDEKLSEGGMGAVYRGTHVLMDKTVAIKVLRPSLAADEKIVARFSREARAASRISHPHALSVTDFGEAEGGIVFLVMEFLNGKTLKDVIRDEGELPLNRVVEILKQVAGALDVAHAQGVVHRDLKSDNIMLLSSYEGDYAKVLDFGIAKIKEHDGEYDPSLTAPDLVIGTPQYMSPEQCSQAPDIDARSDVYSLGVILYEMLVGHVPFTGTSSTQIMLKHLQEPVPSVLEERPDLSPAVATVVARAMAKLPDNRYQSAGQLVTELAAAVGATSAAVPPVERIAESTPSREVLVDDQDEETVIRPRPQPAPPIYRAPQTQAISPESTFNPWKILIPSMVGLLVVFAVIYAFTRGQAPKSTSTEPALMADPNSRPVEPSENATGKNEQGIPAGGAINQTVNANANANANVTPVAAELPSPGNINTNVNPPVVNTNSEQNINSMSSPPPLPSPTRQTNTNNPTEQPTPAQKASPHPSSQPSASPEAPID